jgi:glycosyltransferase involved in cell wall biosynthesis
MNLKIAFDAKRAFFNSSGLGNYSRGVIDMMTEYFPSNNYFLYTPSPKPNTIYKTPENALLKTPERLFDKAFPAYWRSYGMLNQLKTNDIDIFHGLSNELPLNIHKLKAKKIVTIHDLIFLRYPELYRVWDRNIYEKKIKYCCEVADKIISISEHTKSDIIEFIGTDEKKIITVYQTCNKRFKKTFDDENLKSIINKYNLPEEFLLYVGTIEKRKNLLSIVKSFKIIKSQIPLVVVGRPTKYLKEINEFIRQKDLSGKVLFYHNVSNEELPSFYRLAKIFIYPSVFEGFGIPIIEALYSGIPVITSTGSCFSEAGGTDSIYVSPENAEEIADSIDKLLSDQKLLTKMSINGLQFVQKFDDRKVAEDLMNVYKSLI